MSDQDDDKFYGRMTGDQIEPETEDSLWQRLIYMILIALMISVAQTVLMVTTVIQFIIILINNI